MTDTQVTTTTDIQPYRVQIPQAALGDLRDRLRRTIWPASLPGSCDAYGQSVGRIQALAEYWLTSFDWRAVEARLNSWPDGPEVPREHGERCSSPGSRDRTG